MKITRLPIALAVAFPLAACNKQDPDKSADTGKEVSSPTSVLAAELTKKDTPILPLKKGDSWAYSVRVNIPEGVTSPGSAAVDLNQEMERVYVGKMKIADKYPEVDIFEVTRPGAPVERELVDIYENRIMLRGSAIIAAGESGEDQIQWFETPVVFAFAGMRPGQETMKIRVQEGMRERGIQVVAREDISVPAGDFPSIRLLMTGKDGGFLLRKTIWFAPGKGIVKEEKVRYAGDKLLFRETTELVSTTVGVE